MDSSFLHKVKRENYMINPLKTRRPFKYVWEKSYGYRYKWLRPLGWHASMPLDAATAQGQTIHATLIPRYPQYDIGTGYWDGIWRTLHA